MLCSKLHLSAVNCMLITVLILVYIETAHLSIIDTKSPIVIHDVGDGQPSFGINEEYKNTNDNYFGYSLAFMKGQAGSPTPSISFKAGSSGGGTLFIGAPNEKRATKNSGVVWKCNFDGRNAQLSCTILRGLSEQNLPNQSGCPRRYDSLFFPENETEQWIGASLSVSSSGQIFVGAPRWKKNGWASTNYGPDSTCTETAMVGACYRASLVGDNVNVLNPLYNSQKFYYRLTNNVNGYWYLYAELGFSTHVTETERLILGAPSVRSWSGAVVEYAESRRSSPPFIHNDRGKLEGVGEHAYLGYTVTSGRLRTRGLYIASGAPRGGDKRTPLYGLVTILSPGTNGQLASYEGEHFGSYFGFALATADINGDGNDELIVGAPLHTHDFKTDMAYNTGCVFIFDLSLLPSRNPLQPKLCHPRVTMGARFGSAISNLGDINRDMKEDFAISAPYDDDGVGTVFIYYGGNILSEKPSQVIRGKSMEIQGLVGFGTFLLAGNQIDVDGNGTPDLVVSSFESRHVIALRSRPIATASLQCTFHDARSSDFEGQIEKLLPTENNFRVRICIRFHFKEEPTEESQLDAWLFYEMDERVAFINPDEPLEQSHQLSSSQETCLDKIIKLIKNVTEEHNDKPIEFSASVKYNYTEILDSQPVNHASLMLQLKQDNRENDAYQQAYRTFNPSLPAPIPWTTSRKEYLDIAKDNCDSDGNNECDPDLRLGFKLFYELVDGNKQEEWKKNENKALVVGQLESLALTMALSNQKETAYRPTVRVTLAITNNFEFSGRDKMQVNWLEVPSFQCTPRNVEESLKVKNTLRCPHSLQKGSEMRYKMEIRNLRNLIEKQEQNSQGLSLIIEAFPEGQEAREKVHQSVSIPLKSDVKIQAHAPSTKQPEIDPKRTTLVDLTQIYIIKNEGYSGTAMSSVIAEVLVPTHINYQRGNNWTQVIGIADPSNLEIRCKANNFDFFSIQNYGSNQKQAADVKNTGNSKSRSVRSTSSSSPSTSQLSLKVVHPEKVTISQSSEKYLKLSGCKDNGKVPPESCRKISCEMDLPSKGSREIRIQMYLLPEANKKLVSEETKGIRVDSVISVVYFDKKVAEEVGTTQRGFLLEKGIPAWIYLASGAGGTILFLLVTFALFKCGFFRRKKKEELQELKRKTVMHMDANALMALDASIQEAQELPDN